jgi:hypothetical protein
MKIKFRFKTRAEAVGYLKLRGWAPDRLVKSADVLVYGHPTSPQLGERVIEKNPAGWWRIVRWWAGPSLANRTAV